MPFAGLACWFISYNLLTPCDHSISPTRTPTLTLTPTYSHGGEEDSMSFVRI